MIDVRQIFRSVEQQYLDQYEITIKRHSGKPGNAEVMMFNLPAAPPGLNRLRQKKHLTWSKVLTELFVNLMRNIVEGSMDFECSIQHHEAAILRKIVDGMRDVIAEIDAK